MDIVTKTFVVDYKGVKFDFKNPTARDMIAIQEAAKVPGMLAKYMGERLLKIKGLSIDGRAATIEDFLDLPIFMIGEITTLWIQGLVQKMNDATGNPEGDSKKKKRPKKSASA